MPSLRVYLPLIGSPFDATIRSYSAVVSAAVPKDGMLLVDYEGGSRAANIVTFADRCHHAADRHAQNYPTMGRSLAPLDQLTLIGLYNMECGEVSLNGQQERAQLAVWLGLDESVLDRELLTEGSVSHGMRREVLKLHASGDMIRARWLARRYQLDGIF